jgi:general secretion pathway protein A
MKSRCQEISQCKFQKNHPRSIVNGIIQFMYHSFFHLKENPFNITADPDFFYSSARHQEAFAHLKFGIDQRKGIILLTGEIGTGKTTLCRSLLENIDRHVKTALILNPEFSHQQLIRLILNDLGIDSAGKNKFSLIESLNRFLLHENGLGNNVAVMIDEAQNLTVRQLEQIRLLSNLETGKHKLLQIILVGQPELLVKLKLPSLRQLNQRIGVRFHILPLEKNDIKKYITHRLRIASVNPSRPHLSFSNEAMDAIFELSQGTPRIVNLICDRALLAGFAAETRSITAAQIRQAAQEIM